MRLISLALIFSLVSPGFLFGYPVMPDGFEIKAKAAIVLNPDSSVAYSKNANDRLLPASTTKLVTAMVVLDFLSPDHVAKISKNAAYTPTIPPHIRPNDEYTILDLLHLALMKSINSAAVALAEEVAGSEKYFTALMNKKMVEIGAKNTRFANASGLPENGQYTTAYDLALILQEALKYPLIKEIIGKKYYTLPMHNGKAVVIENTDKLLWDSDDMIGGKTGFTRKARHCFVGAKETENGTVITAVLGAPSRVHLWKGTASLLDIQTDKYSQIINDQATADASRLSRRTRLAGKKAVHFSKAKKKTSNKYSKAARLKTKSKNRIASRKASTVKVRVKTNRINRLRSIKS